VLSKSLIQFWISVPVIMKVAKNDSGIEVPILMPDEEVYYETKHGGMLNFMGNGNSVRATNKRILIFEGKTYRSLFYDKIASLNVKRGHKSSKLELNLLGGKEPICIALNKKDALSLFNVISNAISINSDSRIAYAVGTIEAQKAMQSREKSIMHEMGVQMVEMELSSGRSKYAEMNKARTGNGNALNKAFLDELTANNTISVDAKTNDGNKTNISFNFIPKVKGILLNKRTADAIYTLSNSIYSKSGVVADMLYGGAKSTGVILTATMSNIMKQQVLATREELYKNAYEMRYVAINNVIQQMQLEGNPMAYAEISMCFDAKVEEFASNVYAELGNRLVLQTETRLDNGKDAEAHDTSAHTLKSKESIEAFLRVSDDELEKVSDATKSAHDNASVIIAKPNTKKPAWNPDERLLIFKVRNHNEKLKRNSHSNAH